MASIDPVDGCYRVLRNIQLLIALFGVWFVLDTRIERSRQQQRDNERQAHQVPAARDTHPLAKQPANHESLPGCPYSWQSVSDRCIIQAG